MNKLLSYLLFCPFFASCGCSDYRLEGSSGIKEIDGKMVSLRIVSNDTLLTLDSAEIVHGSFSMKGKLDSVVMGNLFFGDENIMPLVVEGGKIKVTIEYNELQVSGTPLNDALYGFINKRNDLDMKIEELDRKEARMILEGANVDDVQLQINKEAEQLVKEMDDHVLKFMSANYETVLGPNVFIMLCSTLPYPIITPQIDDILKAAPYSFKSNRIVKEFINKAKENKELIEEHRRLRENEASMAGN